MTVGATAASAMVAAAAGGLQGAGLGAPPFGDGGAFVTITRNPAVTAALAGGSSVATSVAEMVASGALASPRAACAGPLFPDPRHPVLEVTPLAPDPEPHYDPDKLRRKSGTAVPPEEAAPLPAAPEPGAGRAGR
jgi:hypothetical protein